MRESGDVLFLRRVRRILSFVTPMFLLGLQVSRIVMLLGLPGAFMPSRVLFFSVVFSTGAMGVGSQIAALGGYLLGFAHDCPLSTYCTVRRAWRPKADGPIIRPDLHISRFEVQPLHSAPPPEPSTGEYSDSGPSRATVIE
jgi:hypothetical protein